MTKRDLFRIIIKLFGLYLAVMVFLMLLPQIVLLFTLNFAGMFNWVFLLTFLTTGFLMYILLFKPDIIINLFRLDLGFDEQETRFSLENGESIIRLALIIIGLYLLIDSLPVFVSNIIYALKNSVKQPLRNPMNSVSSAMFRDHATDLYAIVISGIKIVLGYLLITNFKRLSLKIERLNNKNY